MTMRFWILSIGIGVFIIGFALFLFAPRTPRASGADSALATSSAPTVYVHDAYKKGIHTLGITFALPTPCTSATADVELTGSSTIAVAIDMPVDDGICLDQPATTTLTASIPAPTGVAITASVNGAAAVVLAR